ncbi:MAG: glycosyltransferase family 2 protein [Ginsengibacter sp.]
MSSLLVSILMTAYNREKFIAKAIESVLKSTYENWELIIVDDCSNDNTVLTAQQYAEKDVRIKIFINRKNLGDYPNRNKAASYASGMFLKYLDSDDTIHPQGIERMVINMQSFSDAGWGISNFLKDIYDEDLPICLDSKAAYEFHYFKQPIFFASPGQTIIKRDLFEKVGGFSDRRMVSDFDMWHKLSLISPVVLMPGKIVTIRDHENRELNDRAKYSVDYERVKLYYFADNRCPLTSKQINKVKKKRRNTTFKIAVKKILQMDFAGALPRLKVFWFYLWN